MSALPVDAGLEKPYFRLKALTSDSSSAGVSHMASGKSPSLASWSASFLASSTRSADWSAIERRARTRSPVSRLLWAGASRRATKASSAFPLASESWDFAIAVVSVPVASLPSSWTRCSASSSFPCQVSAIAATS